MQAVITITMTPPEHCPKSCTNIWMNHLTLVVMLALFGWTCRYHQHVAMDYWMLFPAIYFLLLAAYDLAVVKVYRREETGLDFTRKLPWHWRRIGLKWIGFLATLSALAFCYYLIPFYGHWRYDFAFQTLYAGALYLIPVSLLYIAWLDGNMREPEDAYRETALLLRHGIFCRRSGLIIRIRRSLSQRLLHDRPLRRDIFRRRSGPSRPLRHRMNWPMLAHHARTWIIKGYFLPIMLINIAQMMGDLADYNWHEEARFLTVYLHLISLMFLIDLTPVVVGYLFNLRLLDTHVRSTDNTWGGWVSCVMCYTPFWDVLVFGHLIYYATNHPWYHWIDAGSTPYYVWGSTLVLLMLAHASSSVAFGLRWSNLTYRGLITGGVFRVTKHPGYLTKNLFWWGAFFPFIMHDSPENMLLNAGGLLCVNAVYYARAKTEERHLMRYEEYRDYAAWMDEHGLLTRWLKYVDPLRWAGGVKR